MLTVEQAKELVKAPLSFGNNDQIQAIRQLEAANSCAKLIRSIADEVDARFPESVAEVQELACKTDAELALDIQFEDATATDRGWCEVSFVADEAERKTLEGWQHHILSCVKKQWRGDAESKAKQGRHPRPDGSVAAA